MAAILLAVGSVALMGSVGGAPRDRIYGLPSDPLAEVWRLAQFDRGEIGLVGNDVSHQANAPSGVPLRRPVDASQILYDAPASILARLLGPVLAYNVLVFLAFWTAGLAAYGAMRWLGAGIWGSATAAALFTAAPVHVIEAQLHVGLALVFMLPLLAALGVRSLLRPSMRRGALFGGGVALCGYVTGYLFLEGVVLAAGVGVAAVWLGVQRSESWRPLGQAAGAAILAAFVLLLPLLVVLVAYRGELAPELDRPLSDVAAFSLRFRHYADSDSTSYIGLAALGAAIAGLILGKVSRLVRVTLALIGIAGLVVSLRPELSFLGMEIPMPSKVIHSVVPYWRVFGRTAVLAALACACLAGILVDRLSASSRAPVRLLALGVALIAFVDIVQRPPGPAADLGRPDQIATALRGDDGAVAEYPLFGFDNFELGPYLLRQIRHGRPLLNGSVSGSPSADLAMAAASPQASEAREALTLAGVRSIVVHAGSPLPRGSGFSRRPLPDGSSLFSVTPTPRAAVAALGGAYDSEPGPDGSPFRWLGPTASVRAVADGPGPVRIRLDAVSFGVPRIVRLGRERREVGTSPTTVVLCVRAGSDGRAVIPISTTPPARLLPGGDVRTVGIGVFHLSAQPGCY